jgi:hypothetical protein
VSFSVRVQRGCDTGCGNLVNHDESYKARLLLAKFVRDINAMPHLSIQDASDMYQTLLTRLSLFTGNATPEDGRFCLECAKEAIRAAYRV